MTWAAYDYTITYDNMHSNSLTETSLIWQFQTVSALKIREVSGKGAGVYRSIQLHIISGKDEGV